jgi:dTDP-4-amino-4,6-dideoxygalactose transaminase
VAVAQLPKLDWVVQRRREVAAALGRELQGVPGLALPRDPRGGRHSWWKYAVMVDPAHVPGGSVELGRRLQARGVHCMPRYIQKPAFECALFQDFHASPVTSLPLGQNPRRHQPQPLFHRRDYPGAVRALEQVIVLPINEFYTDEHVAFVARAIREETARLGEAA